MKKPIDSCKGGEDELSSSQTQADAVTQKELGKVFIDKKLQSEITSPPASQEIIQVNAKTNALRTEKGSDVARLQ